MKLTAPENPYAEDDFDSVIRHSGDHAGTATTDEDSLADVIERDGRMRISRGLPCPLDRYLRAIPDLPARPVALDAAIDVSLRSLQGQDSSPAGIDRSALALTQSHPDLVEQIRLACTLSRELGRTVGAERTAVDLGGRIGRSYGLDVEGCGPRYSVEALLGTGSNGAVYRALDRLLSDSDHKVYVAIKFLHQGPPPSPSDESGVLDQSAHTSLRRYRARLLDEARRTRRVEHPNILRVLDFGVSAEDGAFVVSEFIRGESLQSRVERLDGPMPIRDAAQLVSRSARGVHAAHLAGVLHCDLKPSNILLDADDSPHVADFGTAAVLTELQPQEPAPLGNVAFAAPEQFRREHSSLSRETDVYALGGILTYLVTNQYPNGSTIGSIRSNHASPISSFRQDLRVPGADRPFEAICRKALAPSREARYQSAGELANDLDAWLSHRPVSAWSAPWPARAAIFLRRNRRVVSLSLVAVAALVGLGAFTFLRVGQLQSVRQALSVEADRAKEMEVARVKTLETIKGLYGDLNDRPPGHQIRTPEDVREFMKPLLDRVETNETPSPPP
jgi:Protein kinase domain